MAQDAPRNEVPDIEVSDFLLTDEDVVETSATEVAPVEEAPVVPTPPAAKPANTEIVKAPTAPVLTAAEQALASRDGVEVITFDDEVSRYPVERHKFTTQRKTLMAIIDMKPIAIKTHFHTKAGKFVCFGGDCCKDLEMPNVNYLVPVLIYEVDARGVQPISQNLSLKFISLGQEAFGQIRDINIILRESGQSVDKADLLVTCTDDKYQNVTIMNAGPNRFRKFDDKDSIRALVSTWREVKDTAVDVMAKRMNQQDYHKAMGRGEANQTQQAPSPNGSGEDNFDIDSLM